MADGYSTLDQFIERLKSLRKLTGGEVPVVVFRDGDGMFEQAAAEVQNVRDPVDVSDGRRWPLCVRDEEGTCQVISVF